jgi:aryl-alcohol dehydrogenase-like predicted oxidoreductase
MRPGVSSVVLGASSIRQLYENLRAGDLVLGDEHRRRLDALVAAPVAEAEAWRSVFFDDDMLDELRLS